MGSRIFSVFGRKIADTSKCFRQSRKFCTSNATSDICDVSLSTPPPGFPTPAYAMSSKQRHETKVTTLPNGLRVASENTFGQFSTVGVVIDSGSRYEVNYPSGVSHFIEKLAFGATSNYESRDVILQELEKHGGICDCQGSKDTLIYAISAETAGLSKVLDVLSDVVLRPKISQEEIEESQRAIYFEHESLELMPNQDQLLFELSHAAAYRDNTLGLPKLTPLDKISQIDRGNLLTFMHNYHSPERMVLAGVGMEHDVLVEMAKEYFEQKTPTWTSEQNIINPNQGIDTTYAQYTGGLVKVSKDLSNVSPGPNPMPELAHAVIGLESCSHKDPDFVAFCVLNMLMGGGGSFSAGGPGKGMYTRLYLNVLNRYHWMYSAVAMNHAYNDSGVFTIQASAHPNQLKELIEVIVIELAHTKGHVAQSELGRAKKQLQSMLLMNLESRPVVFEDIGRQVLSQGKRENAEHYLDEIGKISEHDIQRVAERMLNSKPAIAAVGDLTNMPSYEDIEVGLASDNGKMPNKFFLFR
ncbi:unnamed protein product [Owenia fusiformis]|uniref:Mitochondrial-processing peptidase subunit alpha n=1 Tax=Owenia fusiformis TaxID=6347 RepID=A0A8J1XV64_OWEFU|nr:unnamed protein product [Owenia fusiformis]